MIEVIYENEVLRPLEPLDLQEGARLGATLVPLNDSVGNTDADVMTEEQHAALIAALDAIAALPLQSEPQPHTARDHDAILYPKQEPIP